MSRKVCGVGIVLAILGAWFTGSGVLALFIGRMLRQAAAVPPPPPLWQVPDDVPGLINELSK